MGGVSQELASTCEMSSAGLALTIGKHCVVEALTTPENTSGRLEKRPARRKRRSDQQVETAMLPIPSAELPPPPAPVEPSPLENVVWTRILAKRRGLTRLQITLVQAFAEFNGAGYGELGRAIGRSERTVRRMMADPEFSDVLREYLTERKVLGHRKFQRAVEFLADGVLQAARKGYEPNVPLIQTLGKVYGEIGPDQAVQVAQQVNVVSASDRVADILKRVGVTTVSSDRPAEVSGAQQSGGE